MIRKKVLFFVIAAMCLVVGCKEVQKEITQDTVAEVLTSEQEKAAILETLNNETKAAFQRDYQDWQNKWVHEPTITKTYLDFSDSTFSESVGWEEISQFVKTFIEEHPEPEPIPKLVDQIDVKLYDNGAWVIYELQDSIRGLKRETRLMEKVNGEWKIAGMSTTIYGFKDKNNE